MILFIILICLILQRYWQLNNTALSPLFQTYVANCFMLLEKFNIRQPIALALLVMLPILLLVWLLNITLHHLWFNSLNVILQIFILFYCLNLYHPKIALAHYFDAKNRDDEQAAFRYGAEFLDDPAVNDDVLLARAITKKIFSDADKHIFSVLFWYIVLGVLGAVLYAISCSLAYKKINQINYFPLAYGAKQVRAILDWIPMRIVGLTYILVGHFSYGLAYWRKHLFDGVIASSEFAANVGLAALEQDATDAIAADAEENRQAVNLVERTFTLWIVIIAIFILLGHEF